MARALRRPGAAASAASLRRRPRAHGDALRRARDGARPRFARASRPLGDHRPRRRYRRGARRAVAQRLARCGERGSADRARPARHRGVGRAGAGRRQRRPAGRSRDRLGPEPPPDVDLSGRGGRHRPPVAESLSPPLRRPDRRLVSRLRALGAGRDGGRCGHERTDLDGGRARRGVRRFGAPEPHLPTHVRPDAGGARQTAEPSA